MSNYRHRSPTNNPQARKRLHSNVALRLALPSFNVSGGMTFGGAATFVKLLKYTTTGGVAFTGAGIARPGTSQTFTYTSGSLAPITITWDAAANATGYKLYWGTASGVYPNSVAVGNVTQYTLDPASFVAGTPYYFVVTSIYLIGAVASAPANVRLG